MSNNLQFWINSRQFARNSVAFWNKYGKQHVGMSLSQLSFTTRCLADEIRKVEKQLGRPHRYLPQSGIYQGVML